MWNRILLFVCVVTMVAWLGYGLWLAYDRFSRPPDFGTFGLVWLGVAVLALFGLAAWEQTQRRE